MLKRDVLESIATRYLLFLLGAAGSILLTRALGPDGRGHYASMISLVALGTQFGSLGLATSNTYHFKAGKEEGQTLAGNALVLSLVIGLLLSLAAWVFGQRIRGLRQGLGLLPMMAGLATIPLSLVLLFGQNFLIALGKVRRFNLIELARGLGWVALILGFGVSCGLSAGMGVVLNGFLTLLTATYIWYSLGASGFKVAFRWHPGTFRRTARYGMKVYFITLFSFLVLRLDLLMVMQWRGAAEAGAYAVAVQLGDLMMGVAVTLGMLAFPEISELGAKSWPMVRRMTLATGAVLAVGTIAAYALAPRVVGLLFGVRFRGAVESFRVLLPGIWFLSLETLLVQYLNGLGMPVSLLWIWMATLAVNLGLNWLWIPGKGTVGAAWASTLAYGFVAIAVGIMTWRRRPGRSSNLDKP